LRVGYTFHLEDYPLAPGNGEYLVVATKIEIVNNDTVTNRGALQRQYTCDTRFTVQPAKTYFRTPQKAKKPRSHGEVAIVTGYSDSKIWTDKYGRAKVWFPWDREGQQDQDSSCWVRVSSPWQGASYGAIYIPRVGHEVVIGYHDNDPDRPYIAGRHVNQFHEPPWPLPANQALSGWMSEDLEGPTTNSVVTDDTPGKLQVQVTSDHAQSRLVLGSNTRIDRRKGRSEARGEGFELATQAHGVVRANLGMLITTEAREGASAPVKDMGETVQRLTQARELHESLADLAQQNQAQDHGHDQSDVAKAIKAQNAEIRGVAGKSADGTFPELSRPHLILASPAGIETTTAQSTHVASDEHIALTSGQHLSLSAGGRLLASVMNGVRLFCQKAGMKLIAAGGDIDLKALADSVNILAKLNITQTANRITITAREELLINGGGSYTRWNGAGVETGTAGTWTVHSAGRSLVGPKSIAASIPVTDVQQDGPHAIAFMALAAEGEGLKDASLSLFDPKEAKQVLHAVLGSDGSSTVVRGESNDRYDALIGYDGWSGHFEEANGEDEGEMFHPGELDEDRDLELL
jgi:type VI secretion system secreted protein VgrG